jgi:hypothetical protein
LTKEVRIELTRLINSDPNTADQNPETANPDITPDTIISIIALITKVKIPKVNMFMGRVNINRMGRKKAFSMPKIAAAKSAEEKPLMRIPSSRYDVTMMATVKINHLRKSPFINFLHEHSKIFSVKTALLDSFDVWDHSILQFFIRCQIEASHPEACASIYFVGYRNR